MVEWWILKENWKLWGEKEKMKVSLEQLKTILAFIGLCTILFGIGSILCGVIISSLYEGSTLYGVEIINPASVVLGGALIAFGVAILVMSVRLQVIEGENKDKSLKENWKTIVSKLTITLLRAEDESQKENIFYYNLKTSFIWNDSKNSSIELTTQSYCCWTFK